MNDTQSATNTSLNPTERRVDGWYSSPNTRGTIDILWTCVATTFLCTYTILCLNCPATSESWWRVQARKLLWMGIAISGPEFVLTAAAGQLAAARDSVKSFHALGRTKWTYRHAFFANMGGFELNPADGAPFRINSKHIHWLVTRGYITLPEVSDEELWDKSKQDTIAKLITCGQAAYLIIQCVGRAIQGLALTTLELSTMAIVVCAIMTSICWISKPLDIRYPIRIHMQTAMADVIRQAGPIASNPYRQTPLDFVDDLTPSWALNIQPFMKMPVGPFQRPLPRIGDSRLPWLTWTENSCLCLGTMVYASIHLAGWNFHFPSRVEQILWRVSSLILVGSTIAFWFLESLAMGWRYGGGQEFFERLFTQRGKAKSGALELGVTTAISNETESINNIATKTNTLKTRKETSQDKGNVTDMTASQQQYQHETPFEPRELPLVWEFWSIFPIAVIYAFARGYLLVEALLSLRSLPWTAYSTVQWTNFIPHL